MEIMIMVAKEKHCDRYIDVSTKEKLLEKCAGLIKSRLQDGYYEGDREEWANTVLRLNTAREFIGFLDANSHYEYETVSFETLE